MHRIARVQGGDVADADRVLGAGADVVGERQIAPLTERDLGERVRAVLEAHAAEAVLLVERDVRVLAEEAVGVVASTTDGRALTVQEATERGQR